MFLQQRPTLTTSAFGTVPLHLLIPSSSKLHVGRQNSYFSTCSIRANVPAIARTSPSISKIPTSTSSTPSLSHLDLAGQAHMISIASKTPTHRTAVATSTIHFSSPNTYDALATASLQKGDALAVARVAGISAAKKTSDLIPLAHPGLGLTGINIEIALLSPFEDYHGGVSINASVSCFAPTGVEMEALTAATVAGLTIYDMCKAVDKGMLMDSVRVIEKKGGKSGDWVWESGVKVEYGAGGKGWRKARDNAGKAEGHSGEYDWDWD